MATSPKGMVKFNVDGALRENPGQEGIGGILREEGGKVLIQFSLSVGIIDANTAEILAIKKALQMVATSRWANTDCAGVERKDEFLWVFAEDGDDSMIYHEGCFDVFVICSSGWGRLVDEAKMSLKFEKCKQVMACGIHVAVYLRLRDSRAL
ncbi:Uncharacterized protein TCM_015650 [Theobroma cacao]|uniref:RNase H type-1 domain-containing protein n=1 Tax=Theobroma cacao TaxID=3641 RepID=A0A061G2T5_THECC|nr:Uncharacterized protein TCM_015650 [Theobroma cacao]